MINLFGLWQARIQRGRLAFVPGLAPLGINLIHFCSIYVFFFVDQFMSLPPPPGKILCTPLKATTLEISTDCVRTAAVFWQGRTKKCVVMIDFFKETVITLFPSQICRKYFVLTSETIPPSRQPPSLTPPEAVIPTPHLYTKVQCIMHIDPYLRGNPNTQWRSILHCQNKKILLINIAN